MVGGPAASVSGRQLASLKATDDAETFASRARSVDRNKARYQTWISERNFRPGQTARGAVLGLCNQRFSCAPCLLTLAMLQ